MLGTAVVHAEGGAQHVGADLSDKVDHNWKSICFKSNAAANLAHTVRGLARQVDLIQAEKVIAVFALFAPASAEHEHVASICFMIQRVPKLSLRNTTLKIASCEVSAYSGFLSFPNVKTPTLVRLILHLMVTLGSGTRMTNASLLLPTPTSGIGTRRAIDTCSLALLADADADE
jgi:hypothetical protein